MGQWAFANSNNLKSVILPSNDTPKQYKFSDYIIKSAKIEVVVGKTKYTSFQEAEDNKFQDLNKNK